MSGSALDAVRRVHEEKFFKTEQEAEVRRYIARLKAEGRYESAMEAARRRAPTTSVGASALPQIMAHSLRLAGPDEVKVVTGFREQGSMVMYLYRVYKVKNNWPGVITWIDI